ncbi:hypothetical protein CBS147320_10257 [Aspergillus niger]|nr:hypothetical protein CBS133816_7936 [Aspergillus niger]KAI2857772.1 hypothetical protein CBS12448_6332 [Aspergillus niger]KAI2908151.1 hypothetical protein CBS147371_10282 [Aspergillus niger]KAI2914508.1 hypothetical protein CBS147320_10257 [Aspergillus niger]KAI2980713.1 hypothetical protein CBS147344_10183 [Aspergillus niger]
MRKNYLAHQHWGVGLIVVCVRVYNYTRTSCFIDSFHPLTQAFQAAVGRRRPSQLIGLSGAIGARDWILSSFSCRRTSTIWR